MSVSQNLLSIGGIITNALGSLVQKRGVDAEEIIPIGWHRHQQGVNKLTASFAAVPAGQRVRLAQKTSNLVRGRTGESAGVDVSGLTGAIEVDRIARTAQVQEMCTY